MSGFVYTKPLISNVSYTATGAEGRTIFFPSLLGRKIALVTYNTLVLIPETPPLDQQGFFYDSNPASPTFENLILGIPLNPNDVIQILLQ